MKATWPCLPARSRPRLLDHLRRVLGHQQAGAGRCDHHRPPGVAELERRGAVGGHEGFSTAASCGPCRTMIALTASNRRAGDRRGEGRCPARSPRGRCGSAARPPPPRRPSRSAATPDRAPELRIAFVMCSAPPSPMGWTRGSVVAGPGLFGDPRERAVVNSIPSPGSFRRDATRKVARPAGSRG